MANIKSAKKKIKVASRNRERRLGVLKILKKTFKAAEKAILTQASNVQDLLKNAVKTIDKASEHGIIHKNKASRKKSRLQKKYNNSLKK